ncbi:hypothetical protein [Streptomyces sp. NPDC020141]|uniref:hypothetical protein n=1 Tax=Streptomyces sp. NPDC020141 TaxID=3365065 RepID=UPI003794D327
MAHPLDPAHVAARQRVKDEMATVVDRYYAQDEALESLAREFGVSVSWLRRRFVELRVPLRDRAQARAAHLRRQAAQKARAAVREGGSGAPCPTGLETSGPTGPAAPEDGDDQGDRTSTFRRKPPSGRGTA